MDRVAASGRPHLNRLLGLLDVVECLKAGEAHDGADDILRSGSPDPLELSTIQLSGRISHRS